MAETEACLVPPADAPLSDVVRLRILASGCALVVAAAADIRSSAPRVLYQIMWGGPPLEAESCLSATAYQVVVAVCDRQIAAEFARLLQTGTDIYQDLRDIRDGRNLCGHLVFGSCWARPEALRATHRVLVQSIPTSLLERYRSHANRTVVRLEKAEGMGARLLAQAVDGLSRIERELRRRHNWSPLRAAWIAAVVRR